MRPVAALVKWWADLADTGWFGGHFEGATLYPMPGDPRFDRDDLFPDVPLFPRADGSVVRVRDDVWEMPLAWCREYETRPLNALRQTFSLSSIGDAALREDLLLNVKRCVYLELFRSRRPLALSTVRTRRRVYRTFAEAALEWGKTFGELDYADLRTIVTRLTQTARKIVPAIYDCLRHWKAAAPAGYRLFDPPPSIKAVEASFNHAGLDVQNIRECDAQPEADRKWQPFPDSFIAAAGEFCLQVLEHLRPIVNDTLLDLRAFGPTLTNKQLVATVSAAPWPEGFTAASRDDVISLANLCQTASIFVLSLMLGPRWEEVAALPSELLTVKRVGDADVYFIDGSTFKISQSLSGVARDWPIHEMLAQIIRGQQQYVEIAEGIDFRFLWRSHASLFDTGEPKRQISHSLVAFARNWGFAPLLEGTSCHHHRFRKTTARLIVIALHGGPMILRRLFGHEHLGMTLRYILANDEILTELRQIAAEEQRLLAGQYIERRDDLRGGGAEDFRTTVERVIDAIDVYVPEGKRDQAAVTANEILEHLADGPEGLVLKQVLPGLVACFKPTDEPGACSTAGELPNASKCTSLCQWHLEMPEFIEQARTNVDDALNHLCGVEPGGLIWKHYAKAVMHKLRDFPELLIEFGHDPIVADILAGGDGEDRS